MVSATPPPGLLPVVEPVAILGHPVLGVRRLVGGADDPVAQPEVPEVERFQQGVEGARHLESGAADLGRTANDRAHDRAIVVA